MNASDKPDVTNDQPETEKARLTSRTEPEPNQIPVPRTLAAALAASLVTGGIAWAASERLRHVELVQNTGKWGGAHFSISIASWNSAIAYGLLGGLLALALGAASAVLIGGRSVHRIAFAGSSGLLLGAIAGIASSFALVPVYFRDPEHTDVTLSLLIHLGIWGAVGAAAGVAFAIGSGGRGLLARSAVGGFTGAAMGGILFDVVGSVMPLAHTERPLSEESVTRVVAAILLAVSVSFGVVVVAAQVPRNSMKS